MTIHNLSAKDLDTLVRITAAEAGNQGQLGQTAVLHVIKNRMENGGYGGTSVQGVVYKPWQFEPTMTEVGRRNMANVSSRRYEQIEKLALGVFNEDIPDPTGGATHFANVATVRDRRGGGVTDWMRNMWNTKHDIGDHAFFGGDKEQAEAVTQQLEESGFNNLMNKWKQVLMASPEHLTSELTALGDNPEAQELLQKLNDNAPDSEAYNAALREGVSLVAGNAKSALEAEGIAASGRNMAVAEMMGGKTATALLQAEPGTTVGDVVSDDKVLEAAGNLLGKDVKDLTVEAFLQEVEEAQKQDKARLAARARDSLRDENKGFLDKMLEGDMGMMEFLMMFMMLIVMDAMGVDVNKIMDPPQRSTEPEQPQRPAPTPAQPAPPTEEQSQPEPKPEEPEKEPQAEQEDAANRTTPPSEETAHLQEALKRGTALASAASTPSADAKPNETYDALLAKADTGTPASDNEPHEMLAITSPPSTPVNEATQARTNASDTPTLA